MVQQVFLLKNAVVIMLLLLISVVGVDGRELSPTLLDGRGPPWGSPVQQYHGGLQQLSATGGGAKSSQFWGQPPQ
jgi:hypothetical protein